MEFEVEAGKEGRFDLPFWNRIFVSLRRPFFSPFSLVKNESAELLLTTASSICGVTIVRTITVRRLNYEDLPYSLIMNAVWIVIEPCLSVINACLPLLQPIWSSTSMGMKSAFSKISGSGGTSEGTSGVSGGTPSRRYGFAKKPSDLAGSDVDSLKRLKDHHYPLSDLTDSQIEAGYQERSNFKPEMQQNGSIMKPKAGIKVRTDWDVQSQG